MQDVETIRTFLESLTNGFQNRQIVLTSEQDELILNPKNLVKFKIAAKKKKDKAKVEIKISWKNGSAEVDGRTLTIGT
jgi:amphi-Trp domain-containing protein